MTNILDSRPQISLDSVRDLDLADRLPDRNTISGAAEAVADTVVDIVDWADIGEGIADVADTMADAAVIAGRRTSRLARGIGRTTARIGVAGARGAATTASAAGRGIGSTARAARRHPKRTAVIGVVAIGAVTAAVVLRNQRASEERPDLGLAPAA